MNIIDDDLVFNELNDFVDLNYKTSSDIRNFWSSSSYEHVTRVAPFEKIQIGKKYALNKDDDKPKSWFCYCRSCQINCNDKTQCKQNKIAFLRVRKMRDSTLKMFSNKKYRTC